MTKGSPSSIFMQGADTALWLSCIETARHLHHPTRRAEIFLSYLETFPTGAHNRAAAERVEDLIDELSIEGPRRELRRRLRAARDPYMPPVEVGTWSLSGLSRVSV